MKTLLSLGAALAAVVCLTTTVVAQVVPAPAPMMAYAQFTGQKQGKIKGEVMQKGREEQMQLWGFSLEIVSPRDPASGMATGKVQHRTIRLLHKVGAGSVQLCQALVNNENLTTVQFNFWAQQLKAAAGVGSEALHQTIVLNNANVSSYRQFDQPGVGLLEEVTLTYQKITITNVESGMVVQGDVSNGRV